MVLKLRKMIQEYREMRQLIKGMSQYFSKAEISEMLKYCNNSIYGGIK